MKTNTNNVVIWCIILLSITLFAGRAAQTSGYYLFGIIIPSIVLFPRTYSSRFLRCTIYFGLALAMLCLVFSFSNFLNAFLDMPESVQKKLATRPELSFSQKLESQFSSSLFFSGVFIACWAGLKIITLRLRSATITHSQIKDSNMNLMQIFDRALLITSFLLTIWIGIQSLNGYDYRAVQAYRIDRQYLSGLYRAQGFTSHPLTLASMSLALFSFYWARFWSEQSKLRWQFAIVSLLQFIAIFASGGRIAILTGIAALFFTPFYFGLKHESKRRTSRILFLLLLGLIGIVALLAISGVWERFVEALTRSDERLAFWKVHWEMFLDRPLFGHGHAWASLYRDLYYSELGFDSLARKYNAHNIFLQTLSDVGVFGLVAISLIAAFLWRTSRELLQNCRHLFIPYNIAVIANLVHGLTQNAFFDSGVSFVYLYLFITMYWQNALSVHVKS